VQLVLAELLCLVDSTALVQSLELWFLLPDIIYGHHEASTL